MDIAETVLTKLDRFGISATTHGQTTLIAHLKGTHEILAAWKCDNYLCQAGLCHSIYGTESYSRTPATLENREYIRGLIGVDAERVAYLFGAHKKESIWINLDRANGYNLEDRFTDTSISITARDLKDLITLTLGNWLEQRPRAGAEYQFLRKEEFLRSEHLLPEIAFNHFLAAYGISRSEQ